MPLAREYEPHISQIGNNLVFSLNNQHHAEAIEKLARKISDLVEGAPGCRFIIDLQHVVVLDREDIRQLVRLAQSVQLTGHEVHLCGINPGLAVIMAEHPTLLDGLSIRKDLNDL